MMNHIIIRYRVPKPNIIWYEIPSTYIPILQVFSGIYVTHLHLKSEINHDIPKSDAKHHLRDYKNHELQLRKKKKIEREEKYTQEKKKYTRRRRKKNKKIKLFKKKK